MSRLLVALRKDWLRRAAPNVVLNDRMVERLAAENVTAGVAVVPNGSDGDICPLPHHVNPLRRAWRVEGRFVVGYSGIPGRARPADRIADLIERQGPRRQIISGLDVSSGRARLAPRL